MIYVPEKDKSRKYRGRVDAIRREGDNVVISISVLDRKGTVITSVHYTMPVKVYDKMDDDEFRKLVRRIVKRVVRDIKREGMEVVVEG